MVEPARRHLLSQAYLKAFTEGASKKSPLHVFDLRGGKPAQTRPPNVTGRLGAGAFDTAGVDEHVLALPLEQFQGRADRVLQDVGRQRALPRGEAFEVLMSYIAVLLAGNPLLRASVGEPAEDPETRASRLMVSPPAGLGAKAATRPDGESPASVAELRAWIQDDAVADAEPGNHVLPGFAAVEAILPGLFARQWFVIDAAKADASFIASDWPAAVSWQRPEHLPTPYEDRPGLGFVGTDVSLPLRHDLALIGRFEPPPDKAVAPDARLIAAINTRTALFAERYVFAPKRNVGVLDDDGEVVELGAAIGER